MSEYRKDRPSLVVFVNGHKVEVGLTSVDQQAGKHARASFGGEVIFENDTKKLVITGSAVGGFGKYANDFAGGKRTSKNIGAAHVGTVEARVDWKASDTGVYMRLLREGSKNALPRWDASALFLGADYDMTASVHIVTVPNKTKKDGDDNNGDVVTGLTAHDAAKAAKAAEIVADLTK